MWIKCLAEGQMCQALTGIEPQPFDPESRVHSNIPRHLHHFEQDSENVIKGGPSQKCMKILTKNEISE